MPTIVLANTKGGSGKTTAALVLGGQIIDAGGRVVFLEGDPNRPLSRWATDRSDCAVIDAARVEGGGEGLTVDKARELIASAAGQAARCVVIANEHESTMLDWLEAAKAWARFVICDPEGSPNEWMTAAVSQADLVLIPFAPTALDAAQVSRTVATVRNIFRMLGRETPFRTLLTRANGVATKDERSIRKMIFESGVPILETSLLDRPAFRALFGKDALLSELGEEVNGVEKARANAAAYANEVLELLRAQQARKAA